MPGNRNVVPQPSDQPDQPEASTSPSLLGELGGYDGVHDLLTRLAEHITHPVNLLAVTSNEVALVPHGRPSIIVGDITTGFEIMAEAYCALKCAEQHKEAVVVQKYKGEAAVPRAREYADGMLRALGSELQPDQLAELQALLPPEADQSQLAR